jgi:hypothetical protein
MDKLLFWLGIGTTQKVAGSKEVKPGRTPSSLLSTGSMTDTVLENWSDV